MKDGCNTTEGPNMGGLVRAGSKASLEERDMNSLGFHKQPHPWWSWYLQTEDPREPGYSQTTLSLFPRYNCILVL